MDIGDDVKLRTIDHRATITAHSGGPGLPAELTEALALVAGRSDLELVVLDLRDGAAEVATVAEAVDRFVDEMQRQSRRVVVSIGARPADDEPDRHPAGRQQHPGNELLGTWMAACHERGDAHLHFDNAPAMAAWAERAADTRFGGGDPPEAELRRGPAGVDLEVVLADAFRQLSVLREAVTGRRGFDDGALLRRDAAFDGWFEDCALQAMAVLEDLAHLDGLTGLANRRALDRRLSSDLAHAERTGGRFTVAMLDIDGLKQVNDRHGHRAGDDLLCTFAARWVEVLRAGDEIFRVGGDEFVVLLVDAGEPEARRLLERAEVEVAVPFSWGAASFPDDGDAPLELIGLADQRLLGRRAAR